MKSSNIGGQAVIEGVMMKNKERYAVAVRKPDGEIEVTTDTYKSVVGKYTALTKLPFVRGIFNFVDSLVLGMKTLTWSASFYEEEEEKEMTEVEEKKQEKQPYGCGDRARLIRQSVREIIFRRGTGSIYDSSQISASVFLRHASRQGGDMTHQFFSDIGGDTKRA